MSSLRALVDFARLSGTALLDALYPPACLGCDDVLLDGETAMCGRCAVTVIDVVRRGCRRCGTEPLRASSRRPSSCRRCARRRFAFRRAVAAVRYSGAVREAIVRMKFERRRDGVTWFAERLLAACEATGIGARAQAVVPVPLHPWRKMSRGFDQAELLAEGLARRIDRPLLRRALRRVRWTGAQSLSRPGGRGVNVEGAFRPGISARRLRGRRVLLVDDVMSSGATAHHAASALLDAGARSVDVAVVAT